MYLAWCQISANLSDDQGWQYGTVREYGTIRFNYCYEVRYALFVMLRALYVGTLLEFAY